MGRERGNGTKNELLFIKYTHNFAIAPVYVAQSLFGPRTLFLVRHSQSPAKGRKLMFIKRFLCLLSLTLPQMAFKGEDEYLQFVTKCREARFIIHFRLKSHSFLLFCGSGDGWMDGRRVRRRCLVGTDRDRI
jgi:hypothetical protein